jgi:hypothetical protein
MSSTVGYGVEVDPQKFDGDDQYQLELEQPNLQVVVSRAEYGDEERVFVMEKSTVQEVGKSSGTATRLVFRLPGGTDNLDVFVSAHEDTIIDQPNWFLVDYYVYC